MQNDNDLFDQFAPDEDSFWQELITQWEKDHPGPAPKRMYEALEQARRRQDRAIRFLSAQTTRPH